jgi:hypothetical protein
MSITGTQKLQILHLGMQNNTEKIFIMETKEEMKKDPTSDV